jgi:hypothetical protein
MISTFPLWTFHLYVATFQQHLHMENIISLSWFDIPELVVPIRISLIEGCCKQGSYWTKGSSWLSWSHHKVLRSPPWLGWPLWDICVTNDYGYVPLIVSSSRSFPHSWPITEFVTRLTWRVPLVKPELPTLPEHTSSPLVFSEVRVTRSLVLCVYFVVRCLSFCIFSFGHCVSCSSSIYGFWLPLLFLQTLLIIHKTNINIFLSIAD